MIDEPLTLVVCHWIFVDFHNRQENEYPEIISQSQRNFLSRMVDIEDNWCTDVEVKMSQIDRLDHLTHLRIDVLKLILLLTDTSYALDEQEMTVIMSRLESENDDPQSTSFFNYFRLVYISNDKEGDYMRFLMDNLQIRLRTVE